MLETILNKLNDAEIRFIISVIIRHGNRYAYPYPNDDSLKFFSTSFVIDCIDAALQSNRLTTDATQFARKLQLKLDSLA